MGGGGVEWLSQSVREVGRPEKTGRQLPTSEALGRFAPQERSAVLSSIRATGATAAPPLVRAVRAAPVFGDTSYLLPHGINAVRAVHNVLFSGRVVCLGASSGLPSSGGTCDQSRRPTLWRLPSAEATECALDRVLVKMAGHSELLKPNMPVSLSLLLVRFAPYRFTLLVLSI